MKSQEGVLTATWKPTLPRKGRYEIFAFIPPFHATTEKAVYHINTPMGLITATVNQSATVGWAQLTNTITSSYVLNCHARVKLDNDTGEAKAEIAFDTMKFRYVGEGAPCSDRNYLPIIQREPTPTNTPIPTATDTPIPTDTPTVEPTQTNTVESFGSVQAPPSTPTRQQTQTATPTALHIPPTPGVTPQPPTATNIPPSTPKPATNTPSPATNTPILPTSTKIPPSPIPPAPTKTPLPPPTPTLTSAPPPTLTGTPTKTPTPSAR